jgi:hypothetical protein
MISYKPIHGASKYNLCEGPSGSGRLYVKLFLRVSGHLALTFRPNMKAKVMTLDISFMPLRVLIDGHDSQGNLILADNQLAAVIVRLDGETHASEHKGLWNLEAGFGKCNSRDASLFKTPDEAGAWVEQTLTSKAAQFK